jgi:outer membrane lipoprotein SlyB
MDTENFSMKLFATRFVGSAVTALTVSTGVMAQSYYDDQACRQFAETQVAPLRDQANSQAIGGTLLGAGLGAAFGAAVGGGRGAGIGAASGAIVGTGVGAANAQNAAGYLQQQYNGYYAQCMASRRYPPPQYNGPAPGYAQAPGYSPTPSYGLPPGYSSSTTGNDLNRQELNRLYGPPSYPPR